MRVTLHAPEWATRHTAYPFSFDPGALLISRYSRKVISAGTLELTRDGHGSLSRFVQPDHCQNQDPERAHGEPEQQLGFRTHQVHTADVQVTHGI